jgi:tetratricopeptide (TPR) repeat protein
LRCLPALLLAAFASAAFAQEPDDFSFAKRLAYRGWFDLAKDVCDRIEKDTSLPRDVRTSLPILLAEIDLAKADREQDTDKAMKHITESIARLQKFIADEGNHPRIFEAQINIGYLKSRKAKSLVDQLETARSADDHDRLRKEAAALYEEVTQDFEKSASDWRRLQSTEEIAGAIMDARLEAERARYEHARIPNLPEVERKKLLEDAVKHLVDFEIDYGDTAKAFEAMLLDGKCQFELGEYAQAETKLKNTYALKEVLEKMKIARNPYFDQIIFGAYLSTAQLYLKTNRPKDAKAFIDGVFKSDRAVEREWISQALLVEKVDALIRLKEFNVAKVLAQKIIDADPNGRGAAQMREKLRTLGGQMGSKLDPGQAIEAAEGSVAKGRMRDAMATLRQAIESCITDETRAKYVPRALYLMGQCLLEMGRPYEAAMTFEKVYSFYPKNDLAPDSLFQAVVCFSEEFDSFGDKADDQEKNRLMDTLVKAFPGHPVTDSILYLQGRTLENARKHREAAEKYLQVPARATAYERALVRGAYCLRADAFRQYDEWQKSPKKDPAVQKAILEQLMRAEAHFKIFLKRVEDPNLRPTGPEGVRDRATLVLVVNQEMAYLYNHKLVGKAAEALEFLEKVAKDIPVDDDRMAKILQLQIQSHLVLNQNDQAVNKLEMMFDRFPHVKETAQAARSVGIRLDEITTPILNNNKGAELDESTKENLKKISRYYDKWLKGAMAFSMEVTVDDVKSVGETLYMTAKRLNGIPDDVASFMDMKTPIVAWKNYFEDAEFVHSLLVSDKFRKQYSDKDRLILMARRARCLSFIADQSETWLRAKSAYEDIIKEYKVDDGRGGFDRGALVKTPTLVGVYIELGTVYFNLGRWNKIHYDNAITVFANVLSVSAELSEPWWISKYMIIYAHFLRGVAKDIMAAQTMMKMLMENHPEFDGGKYGMKDKFLELKRKIDAAR